jgi:hypothetical protein
MSRRDGPIKLAACRGGRGAAAAGAPDVADPRPTGQQHLGAAGPGTPEETRRLPRERDRIAQRLSNIVVHRLFAAGLDLRDQPGYR